MAAFPAARTGRLKVPLRAARPVAGRERGKAAARGGALTVSLLAVDHPHQQGRVPGELREAETRTRPSLSSHVPAGPPRHRPPAPSKPPATPRPGALRNSRAAPGAARALTLMRGDTWTGGIISAAAARRPEETALERRRAEAGQSPAPGSGAAPSAGAAERRGGGQRSAELCGRQRLCSVPGDKSSRSEEPPPHKMDHTHCRGTEDGAAPAATALAAAGRGGRSCSSSPEKRPAASASGVAGLRCGRAAVPQRREGRRGAEDRASPSHGCFRRGGDSGRRDWVRRSPLVPCGRGVFCRHCWQRSCRSGGVRVSAGEQRTQ